MTIGHFGDKVMPQTHIRKKRHTHDSHAILESSSVCWVMCCPDHICLLVSVMHCWHVSFNQRSAGRIYSYTCLLPWLQGFLILLPAANQARGISSCTSGWRYLSVAFHRIVSFSTGCACHLQMVLPVCSRSHLKERVLIWCTSQRLRAEVS